MYVVYEITNNISDKKYVGSTANLEKRFKRHLKSLQNNTHHSVYFQRFYNKCKSTIELSVKVVSEHKSRTECYRAEQILITSNFENLLNTSKVASGGDLLSYHPNRSEICKQISQTLKYKYANGKIILPSVVGTLNPNYKRGHTIKISVNCKSCGDVRVTQTQLADNLCPSCTAALRVKDKNPFYGKTHTEETRQVIASKARQRALDKQSNGIQADNAVPIFAYGIFYPSCKAAAKALYVSSGTIWHRLKSLNWDFRSVYLAHAPKKFEDLVIIKKDCQCIIDGLTYTSVKEASFQLRIPYSTLMYRCESEKPEASNYILKRPTSIESEYQITQQVE